MKALLVVAAVAAVAHAGPVVDVTIAQADVDAAFQPLVPQYDEPIGLAVLANNPKLGLLKGDLVRAVNGEITLSPVSMSFRGNPPLIYLDVLRGGKPVVVRIAVTREAIEEHVDKDRYKDTLDMLQTLGAHMFKQVTKNGNPSGLTVEGYFPPLAEGDIIRKIDGVPMTGPTEAINALVQTGDHKDVNFEIERLGKTIVAKIIIDPVETIDPALLAGIVKKTDTTYEVPKDVVDALLANPMAMAKGVRVVPAVKDGKPSGFKLYAIRPSSLPAHLGFANGDTVRKINGTELTSADKALEVYTKLRDAKKLTVEIERRGAAMTFTYTIKN